MLKSINKFKNSDLEIIEPIVLDDGSTVNSPTKIGPNSISSSSPYSNHFIPKRMSKINALKAVAFSKKININNDRFSNRINGNPRIL